MFVLHNTLISERWPTLCHSSCWTLPWYMLVSTYVKLATLTISHTSGIAVQNKSPSLTTPLPPQEAEKIWHGSSDPQKVLQLHHWVHLDWLHHHLVWQLLGIQPQGATEGSAHSLVVHHWARAPCHLGPLYQAVSEEGPKNGHRLQPPKS